MSIFKELQKIKDEKNRKTQEEEALEKKEEEEKAALKKSWINHINRSLSELKDYGYLVDFNEVLWKIYKNNRYIISVELRYDYHFEFSDWMAIINIYPNSQKFKGKTVSIISNFDREFAELLVELEER